MNHSYISHNKYNILRLPKRHAKARQSMITVLWSTDRYTTLTLLTPKSQNKTVSRPAGCLKSLLIVV
jgi:hypothetical protein